MQSLKSAKWILEFIRGNSDRPMKLKELARSVGVKSSEYARFRSVVKKLLDEGKLIKLKRGRIGLPDQMALITGTLSITRSGFGFVACDGGDEEIFIAARDLLTAFDGDRVMARLKPKIGFKGKREGVILEVVERRTKRLVGRFRKARGYCYVVPEEARVGRDIYVIKGQTGHARDGEMVVIDLEPWVDPALNPEGRVIERLGQSGERGVDTLTIIRRFELPTEFPREVQVEAEEVAADWTGEMKKRRDLTGLTLFTIDPADARDFDDAVSLEIIDGNYRLGVHIADVSHFVRSNTKLDREAFDRGTSVYFPDRVVPMLPEKLSNDVCSLRPNRKRLAFTIFIDFNPQGRVLGHELFPSVIKSRARLTYDEVQEFFDGDQPSERIARVTEELTALRRLARILYKRRYEDGSLDFDLPEAKIIMDKKGNVVEIGNRVRTESHRLVEEFMLAANREVALHFFRDALPILYRVHERPDMERLEAFAHLVRGFGYRFSVSPQMPTRDFARFLGKVKGKPEEELINELMLRSMKKAIYQPANIGHFGLAFKHYLHFTSPIRRYPDLLVHRLLKQIKNGAYPVRLAQKLGVVLTNVGEQTSLLERRAMVAEREAVKAKQVDYMSGRLGEEYEGVISGIIGFGFFVRLIGPGCEGLVRMSTLDDDYYLYDEAGYRMVGRRKGKVYRLGDKVRVGIMRVNVEAREIDLFVVSPPRAKKAASGQRKVKGKRK